MDNPWQLASLTTADVLSLARASLTELATRTYTSHTNLERLAILDELEHITRTGPGIGHELINQLAAQNAADELHSKTLRNLISERLHITEHQAGKRITDAAALGPGTTLAGQPLDGPHARTGNAQRDGDINTDHVETIIKFFSRIPADTTEEDKDRAEATLVDLAKQTHLLSVSVGDDHPR